MFMLMHQKEKLEKEILFKKIMHVINRKHGRSLKHLLSCV